MQVKAIATPNELALMFFCYVMAFLWALIIYREIFNNADCCWMSKESKTVGCEQTIEKLKVWTGLHTEVSLKGAQN